MAIRRRVEARRVYEPRVDGDGRRVLVDRVWPRGLRRDDPRLDEWCKDIAPSAQLRSWYGHRQDRFTEFRQRYLVELDDPTRATALDHLANLAVDGPVTLLTATRSLEISHPAVLAELLCR